MSIQILYRDNKKQTKISELLDSLIRIQQNKCDHLNLEKLEGVEIIFTDKGASRWGHLSSKAAHSDLDRSNQSTRSRLRSWKGVGRSISRSSIRETGYQCSLHENLDEDEELSPSSSSSLSSNLRSISISLLSDWNWPSCCCCCEEEVVVVGGADTDKGGRKVLRRVSVLVGRGGERKVRSGLVEGNIATDGVEKSNEDAI